MHHNLHLAEILFNIPDSYLQLIGRRVLPGIRLSCSAAVKSLGCSSKAFDSPQVQRQHIVIHSRTRAKASRPFDFGCVQLAAAVEYGRKMTKEASENVLQVRRAIERKHLEDLATAFRSALRNQDKEALVEACDYISKIPMEDSLKWSALEDQGVNLAALHVLKLGKNDVEITISALGAVLATCRSLNAKRAMGMAGACEIVLKALEIWGITHFEVAKVGCDAVDCLATGTPSNSEILNVAGCCEIVSQVLWMWGLADAQVAIAACNALCHFGAYRYETHTQRFSLESLGNSVKLVQTGAYDCMVKVMKKWGVTNADAAEASCRALTGIVKTDIKSITDSGACAALVEVLKSFGVVHEKVALAACRAMATFVVANIKTTVVRGGPPPIEKLLADENIENLTNLGAFEALALVLKEFGSSNEMVGANGCLILSCASESNTNAVCKSGADIVIVAILKKHGASNETIAAAGCQVVSALAVTNASALAQVGVCEAVTLAFNQWYKGVQLGRHVQSAASKATRDAVNNLIKYGDENLRQEFRNRIPRLVQNQSDMLHHGNRQGLVYW